ncbi:MAG: tetratricopeptide repeat protein [Alphaproteobacteria bacterium]
MTEVDTVGVTAIALVLSVLFVATAPAWGADDRIDAAPLLSAPPAVQPPGPPRSAAADAAAYESCMKLARDKPEAGRKRAQEWRESGGGHPADHCFAVALIGLGQYKEAGDRLEALGRAMVRAPDSLRAEVFDQAGQAWMLAGDPAHAYAAAGLALELRPGDPDLLLDRAEAAGAAGWYDKAMTDLDRVLTADPTRVDALIYRAAANRALNRLDPAFDDISQAVTLAPDSVPALLERGNIRSLRGDLEGARLDWQRVSVMSPGSTAAKAAGKNLERLANGG